MVTPFMKTIVFAHAGTDDRRMYADYLRAHGFHVHEAGTTDAALAAVESCEMVITGLLIPGSVDGLTLIARIRANHSSMPILVVTACSVDTMHHAARLAGCDELLLKPCFPEDLLDTVWRLLNTPHEHRNMNVAVKQ